MNTFGVRWLMAVWVFLGGAASGHSTEKGPLPMHQVTVVAVEQQAVDVTQSYVGRITAHRHVEIHSPETRTIHAILYKAGQEVKKDDVLFQLSLTRPGGDAARDDAMAVITAPFDGLMSRPLAQVSSVVTKGETLATVSDNSVMWIYFHVPEAQYFEFTSVKQTSGKKETRQKEAENKEPDQQETGLNKMRDDLKIDLVLANGQKFPQSGKLGAIAAEFDSKTGTIAFRADFSNPKRLLRHNQTGTVIVSRVLKEALVVPQRATFEVGEKRYVYVVDNSNRARRQEIVVQHELKDLFVIKSGIESGDKIVLNGISQIHDGDKVQ